MKFTKVYVQDEDGNLHELTGIGEVITPWDLPPVDAAYFGPPMGWRCGECGERVDRHEHRFCPNCGFKMRWTR